MPTVSELFSDTIDKTLVIDWDTKTIKIPSSITNIGVESDDETTILDFKMPRYKGKIDLKGYVVRINYHNANGEGDVYTAKDVAVDDEFITFSWEVGRFAVMYKGDVKFIVCAKKFADDGVTVDKECNTTTATLPCLVGLETEQAVVESYPDAIASAAYETILLALDSDLKGDPGYTPVKGTDYYTPAEREEFLNDVVLGAKALYANAFINEVSGEVIRVDDVSPIEHSPEVKACGKNLFNMSLLSTTIPKTDSTYISEVGEDYFVITTGEEYSGNGFHTTQYSLREFCPQLEVGKTYTLSGTTESKTGMIYMVGLHGWYMNGKHPQTVTKEMLDAKVVFYGLSVTSGQSVGDCRISNIQIEEGTVATEYEPYIDPTTVTLTRCGKNMLDIRTNYSETVEGVTFTFDKNGKCTINGTNTSNEWIYVYAKMLDSNFYISKGTTVTVSGIDCDDASYAFRLFTDKAIGNTIGGLQGDFYKKSTITVTEDTLLKTLLIRVAPNAKINKVVVTPMIEIGNTATDYEAYKGETYTPNANGTVDISTVSPTMTLMTNTPGLPISCKYARDTNVVMGDIQSALTELHNYAQGIVAGGVSV